jgi:protein-tyrosine phosphatase
MMPVDPVGKEPTIQPIDNEDIKSPHSDLHEKIPVPAQDSGYTLSKKVAYEVSLGYAQFAGKEWWSKIGPHNLYLGGLPLKNAGHLEQIKALGVTHVICLVEDFELENGWLNQPIQKSDWEAAGIEVIYVPAVDFTPLPHKTIETVVEKLTALLKDGKTPYLHCKRGVGRSASIVVAYFMQAEGLSYDKAHAYVKQYRPDINLNASQQQAILRYFNQEAPQVKSALENTYETTLEALSDQLVKTLDYVIDGVPNETGWGPSIASTYSRKDRYLKEFGGNQEAAISAAIQRSHSNYVKKAVKTATVFIPVIGTSTSYSYALWHQLREVALIAALYGHDLNDPQVRMKILGALIVGDALKIPANRVDILAKAVVKAIATKVGLGSIPGFAIPAHLIFNYLTDNAAKVSTYAKAIFKR